LLIYCLPVSQVIASVDRPKIASICDEAARIAARESDVPLDVLRAISLTETGRKADGSFLPWPWTVNMEGIGKWFDDPASARAYVDKHFARGARSFDVGCFQINYKWHGQAFESIEAMFDPVTNARYAAGFLRDLYAEMGDWSKAAGAYHSRTPKFARKYAARFDRIRAGLGNMPATSPGPSEPPLRLASGPPRLNRFPLLQRGHAMTVASLVPLSGAGQSGRFIDMSSPRPLLEER